MTESLVLYNYNDDPCPLDSPYYRIYTVLCDCQRDPYPASSQQYLVVYLYGSYFAVWNCPKCRRTYYIEPGFFEALPCICGQGVLRRKKGNPVVSLLPVVFTPENVELTDGWNDVEG